ncbi:hypothetical protein AB2L57_10765 [Microbacterium sp. HA-8]|uniref:hypothetical protein n=1 Tax=Microbacterium sp. HA-8 TaxID=3234200 RepID=UPI0038F75385
MPRLIATRRAYNAATGTAHDISGATPAALAEMISRLRAGTTLTLWHDTVSDPGHLARVTRVRTGEQIVEVLDGDALRTVIPADACPTVALIPTPAGSRIKPLASIMDAATAARVASEWMRSGELTREWIAT